ncbi:MAG: extracellular solute-binding protein [Lentisphaerae bacterium]|nr:extracellular solute-binding protein [Lentisphaerota bacterium]
MNEQKTMPMKWFPFASGLALSLGLFAAGARGGDDAPPPAQDITITSRYNVQQRLPKNLRDFLRENPHVRLKQWSGIDLPGGMQASLAMGMAGNVGPDIFETDIRQAVEQGLAYPLTEWVGQDGVRADGTPKLRPDGKPDVNGQIDADEARWDGWMKIKPVYRQVITVDGVPYSLPWSGGTYVGILYSYRVLRAAGLDPAKPPRSYDELVYWARKLYDPKRKTYGFQLTCASWSFAPWVATTESSIVVQDRVSPTTGKVHTFNEQETRFVVPETGEDLSNVRPTAWRCNVAGEKCTAAIALYHRLRWQPWMLHPRTGEPVELTPEAVAAGQIEVDGETLSVPQDAVIEGSIGVTPYNDMMETIRRMGRDVGMFPLWSGDMTEFEGLGIQPEDMGMMPFPGMTKTQRPVLQASNCFFMMGKDVLSRGGATEAERKAYRDRVWQVMTLVCSPEGNDENIRRKVAAGQARFLNPRELKRLGFDDYLKEAAPEYVAMWEQIDRGEILEVVEPFMGKWVQFRDFYQREVIDLVLRPAGRDFDYPAALRRLEREANSGTMFARPDSELDRYRPRTRAIVTVVAAAFALLLAVFVRGQMRRKASLAGVYKGFLPWLLLAPALISILVWSYYPLLRGMVMAFQNYKIVGASPFVGLSNFIGIMLDPNFYHYIWTTFRFVLWNLVLAFFTPIVLAVMLAEAPRLKVFFRTIFFLPQMTSALVVTLMWKEMFMGGAQGTANRFLGWVWGLFGQTFVPVDWLGDPRTVMACVILPGVWAGAGIGSLIYLAALKSVPEDLYEAASLDGAGMRRKFRHITLPTIMPLVLINFVGAFIATFQTMGNIFLLTFGGPGKETMVMGLAIWQEAYVNLRFSIATAYAWILGGILIGFMLLQLRLLRQVDFRQAQGDE